jgi:hypothetical protein
LGPGQGRPRPGEGRQPEFPPPPTITEYHPRSTLVVPVHLVPRARYPVIDIHGHPPALLSDEVINRVGAAMDSLNLRVMVNANGNSGDRLTSQIAAVKASRYQDRLLMFATLVKYQDRILFGKDAFQPDEYPYYWRVFETEDEYFDYYRDYHAFWRMYGLGLPDSVLKKVYYQNALKIIPGVPRTGFP